MTTVAELIINLLPGCGHLLQGSGDTSCPCAHRMCQRIIVLVKECAGGRWPQQKIVCNCRRGIYPRMFWSACDQLVELKENKGRVSFLQGNSAALRQLQQMGGPLLWSSSAYKSHGWPTWALRIQQNSSSFSASPTSSVCLSGSLSTKLLSECLSERRELMETRL